MNLKNIDLTGLAILVGGTIILYAGYKLYSVGATQVDTLKKAKNDAMDSVASGVNTVIEAPGRAITRVGDWVNSTFSSAPSIRSVLKGDPPLTFAEIEKYLQSFGGRPYGLGAAPTQVDVLNAMASDGAARLGERVDGSGNIGYIGDSANLNGNF
jgi:hypothetical protein